MLIMILRGYIPASYMSAAGNHRKIGDFARERKKSVQWFHTSVQPLHTFLPASALPRNIAPNFKRNTPQWTKE
ncbi:hypothetical protein [uncultured Duncaniella sp.]|uniref:hypothetical protein n=1 Tax=uncultured Duncaniella sp. TaxID=2768039 RepID=UPI00265ADCD6|nr:hypothetical protein [uncultured Duncaniella sp.]